MYDDSSVTAFDGIEDTLVGVQNDSGVPLGSIWLDGGATNDIFGFDGDGLCSFVACSWPHPSSYEGPLSTFAPVDNFKGLVSFTGGGVPAHGSTYFSLEEQVTSANVVADPGSGVSPSEFFGGGNPSISCFSCEVRSVTNFTGWPVDASTGNFWHTFGLLSVPGRGPALDLSLTYNALGASNDSPFGFGWTSSYGMSLTIPPGGNPVTVTQENGSEVQFTLAAGVYSAPARVQATLTHNGDGTWTFVRQNRQTFTFDSAGRLTAITDLNGYATTLAYVSGNLATVTDPTGRRLSYDYASAHVASVTDDAGRSVAFDYSAAGDLTGITDVGGGVTTMSYDSGSHLLLQLLDPVQQSAPSKQYLTNVYDGNGRVVSQTDLAGRTTTFDYTSLANATKVTDPAGHVTVEEFSGVLPATITRGYGTPNAASWTNTFDSTTFELTDAVDPNGHKTHLSYDAAGNVLTKTIGIDTTVTPNTAGRTTSWTYDAHHDVIGMTDPKQVSTTYTYDGAGNLLTVSTPLVEQPGQTQTTTFTYADSAHPGDVTSVTDARGKVWSYGYDADTGDLLSATTPVGDITTYTYDNIGRRITMVSPKGYGGSSSSSATESSESATALSASSYTTTYDYNPFGELTSVIDPLGHETQYSYDADARLHQTTDGLSHTTTYDYDTAGVLTTITRPDTTTLHNDYWPDGSLKSQTDGAGHATSYAYDSLGRLSASTDPNNRTTSYTYDGAGNLATMVDPASRTTTFGYDAADRRTSITYSDGVTPNVTYGYDDDDQRTTITDGTGTSSWTWDSLHRLTAETNGAGQTMSYGYDLAGNLTSIIYPGSHTVTRGYDDASRLHTITDWLSHTSTFGYDENSNLTSQAYPNGTTATYTPDNADRLMSITDKKAGTTFASFTYTRNNADMLTGVSPTGVGQANQSYTYTALDQLQTVNGGSYNFDAADNLTATPDGTKLAYDNGNQLCWTAPTTGMCASPPSGATTYSYSSLGERTATTPPTGNPTIGYAYDQASRLTEVRGAGYRTAVLGSNPTGYWRLGDASGTTAADSSGNANPGTYSSATLGAASALTTDANKAATFTGTSTSNVVLPATNSFDYVAGKKFTLEAWVKAPAAQTSGAGIITRGYGGGGEQYTIDLNANKYRFFVRNSAGAATAVNSTVAVDNTWQHVVAVFDQPAGRMELWVNDVLAGTATPPTTLVVANGNPVIGGRKSSSSDANYSLALNGSVDEVALYPRGLTAGEIATHYQAGNSNYAGTTVADAPTVYYRLNETSGTVANDRSGHSHTGTYVGGYTQNVTGALSGDTNKAVTFNGTTGYVDAGDLSVGESATFSVEAWLKTTAAAQTYVIGEASSTSGNPANGLSFDATGAKARFIVRDNAATTVELNGTTTVNNGAWHHVVGVRNGTSFKLYVDGHLDAGTNATLSTISLNSTSVGALRRPGGFLYFFNGSVDETAYYPTALTAAQVARHYRNGTNSTPTVAAYTYNGDGLRAAKTVAGTTTSFTWTSTDGLPLLASDGTSQFIYGPNGPLEQVSSSTVTYYHQDAQASTRALTDQSGNVAATYSTDAYGNSTASSGTQSTALRYDGEYRDNETGLVYLRARYYDPATADFVSRDPFDEVTRSAYGYANGDPTNGGDPSGLNPFSDAWNGFTGVLKCAAQDVYGAAFNSRSCADSGTPSTPTGTTLHAAEKASAVVTHNVGVDVTACDLLCIEFYANAAGETHLRIGLGPAVGLASSLGPPPDNPSCEADQFFLFGGPVGGSVQRSKDPSAPPDKEYGPWKLTYGFGPGWGYSKWNVGGGFAHWWSRW